MNKTQVAQLRFQYQLIRNCLLDAERELETLHQMINKFAAEA